MRKTRLYNTSTGKWEWWTVTETPLHPWRFTRLHALRALRRLRDRMGNANGTGDVWDFDTATMRMMRPQGRRERFARVADAVLSMVKMQKFIK